MADRDDVARIPPALPEVTSVPDGSARAALLAGEVWAARASRRLIADHPLRTGA